MGNKRENDFYTISRENYLIATYLLQKKNGQVRSVDIAEMLGYSKPSVSKALFTIYGTGQKKSRRDLQTVSDCKRLPAADLKSE